MNKCKINCYVKIYYNKTRGKGRKMNFKNFVIKNATSKDFKTALEKIKKEPLNKELIEIVKALESK